MNNEAKTKRLNVTKYILIAIEAFIAIGALYGGIMMLLDPSGKMLGMDNLLPYFMLLPFADILFKDYLFSGIMLIIVNGITNIIAIIFLIMKKHQGFYLGAIFGLTLVLWICIQFYMFPLNALDIIFFSLGLIQLLIGITSIIFYKQTRFIFNENDYINISQSSNTIVLYFSRMGYAKKLAYEIANQSNYQIKELTVFEHTKNTSGFWWCGRYAMHKWQMNITNCPDLNLYDKIIIVGQIWCFKISAPIRNLLIKNKDKFKNKSIELNILHFNKTIPHNAIKEINSIVGTNTKINSYICKYGEYKKTA